MVTYAEYKALIDNYYNQTKSNIESSKQKTAEVLQKEQNQLNQYQIRRNRLISQLKQTQSRTINSNQINQQKSSLVKHNQVLTQLQNNISQVKIAQSQLNSAQSQLESYYQQNNADSKLKYSLNKLQQELQQDKSRINSYEKDLLKEKDMKDRYRLKAKIRGKREEIDVLNNYIDKIQKTKEIYDPNSIIVYSNNLGDYKRDKLQAKYDRRLKEVKSGLRNEKGQILYKQDTVKINGKTYTGLRNPITNKFIFDNSNGSLNDISNAQKVYKAIQSSPKGSQVVQDPITKKIYVSTNKDFITKKVDEINSKLRSQRETELIKQGYNFQKSNGDIQKITMQVLNNKVNNINNNNNNNNKNIANNPIVNNINNNIVNINNSNDKKSETSNFKRLFNQQNILDKSNIVYSSWNNNSNFNNGVLLRNNGSFIRYGDNSKLDKSINMVFNSSNIKTLEDTSQITSLKYTTNNTLHLTIENIF